MTPAQQRALAVALDGLREQEVSPADVVRALYPEAAERMLRAAKPSGLDELREIAEAAFVTYQESVLNNDATWPQVAAGVLRFTLGETALDSEARARFARLFSPPETPAATPAHRPTAESQAPSGDKHVCGATYGVRCDACGAAP